MAAKCLVRTFFRLDLNLAKWAIDDLLCERLLKLVKIKVYVRRVNSKKRLNFYIRAKFREKSHKKQKIFFCKTVAKFQEISTLNICDGAKQIYP